MYHKSGFVNILGNPNVGKSTLMNSIIGERLSITTLKPQTTRQSILGILNELNFQIIFCDTPGIIKPVYFLHKIMMKYVKKSLKNSDVILYITDIYDTLYNKKKIILFLKKIKIPFLFIINKIDKFNKNDLDKIINFWKKLLPNENIIPISSLKKNNIDILLKKILFFLPISPPFYSKFVLTNKSEIFFISEIIREKIFILYKKEIPYSVQVITEFLKKKKNIIYIHSIIYIEKKSQKYILIGKKGKNITKLGFLSRKKLEKFFKKNVFLYLYVKIKKNWRYNKVKLKNLGFF
jgi:GTP-binding protein Era